MAQRNARTRPLVLTAIVCATSTIVMPVAGARAQNEAEIVADSYLITNAADSAIRSGADLAWYVVAQFDKGTVLRMSGEVDNWFRVEYPAGTPAVVKSADAELHEDKGIVTLTRRSSLLAFNLFNPYMEECYKRLFAEQPLMPGTELKYIGPMRNGRGELAGYKVIAPAGAQGFILPANVRPATPEEVRAIVGAPATTSRPAQVRAPETSPRPVESEPGARPAPAATTPAVGAPDDAMQSEPAPTEDEADEGATAAPARPRAASAWNGLPRRLEDVDAAYKRVMKQSIESAEFSQLIAEYEAILGSLPSGEEAEIERAYVEDQIGFLRMRAQIQEDMRNLAALEAQTESAQQTVAEFVEKIQAARGYIVVGTLSPSIIYDGKRLPRMFRVVSVDAASGGRTLAYVLPDNELGMVGKLGSLVGVQGEDDPTAGRGEVRVIKPTVVDVLSTEGGNPAPAPATAVSDGSEPAGS